MLSDLRFRLRALLRRNLVEWEMDVELTASVLILLLVGALAASGPSRRALRLDPVRELRRE